MQPTAFFKVAIIVAEHDLLDVSAQMRLLPLDTSTSDIPHEQSHAQSPPTPKSSATSLLWKVIGSIYVFQSICARSRFPLQGISPTQMVTQGQCENTRKCLPNLRMKL